MLKETSPELRESLKAYIQVDNTVERSGLTLAELAEQAIVTARREAQESPEKRSMVSHKLGLREDVDLPSAIEQRSRQHVELLNTTLESRTESAKAQALHSLATAIERGYVTEPKKLNLSLVDNILEYGLPEQQRHGGNAFLVDQDRSFVWFNDPNRIVTHELGHALSSDLDKRRAGFMTYVKGPEGAWDGRGNNWFNEGATVLWEDRSVIDADPVPGRDHPEDYWRWNQAAVRLVCREAGIDEEMVMRAYFGNDTDRKMMDEQFRQRFGTDLAGLAPLSQRLDIAWTEKVVSGQPISIDIDPSIDHESKQENIRALAKIFPNVNVVYSTS